MTVLILLLLKQIKNKVILICLLFLLIFERLPINFPLSPNIANQPFIAVAQKLSTKAILNLPTYSDWWNGQKYDFYSSYIDKPMVNAYVQWSGNTTSAKTIVDQLEDYSCQYNLSPEPPELNLDLAQQRADYVLKMMKNYEIRILIIHKDLSLSDPRCKKASFYIQTLLDKGSWKQLYVDTDKAIYWLQ
jgi:hypothetical protein